MFDWQIPSLAEQDEFVTLCYYGPSGHGKTSAAVAGMSRLGPTIVVDAEGGLKRRALTQRGTVVEQVMALPKPGQRISYTWLDKLYFRLQDTLEKNPGSLAGVVLDTGTAVAQILLEETSLENTEKAARQNKPRSPFQVELQDHGMTTDKMRSLLRRYRTLPCHLAITAQERRDQDDDGKVRYGPAFGPATQQAVMELCDVVLHLEPSEVLFEGKGPRKRPTGPVVYKALSGTGTKFLAKDRYDVLPRLLVDPYFDRVLAYVEGKIVEADDPVQDALRGVFSSPVEDTDSGDGPDPLEDLETPTPANNQEG